MNLFRIFSNIQNLFSLCSECSVMFRLCSVHVQNVQNLFRIFINIQYCSESVQYMFSLCSECSVMFRLCSVHVQNLFRIFSIVSNVQNLFSTYSVYVQNVQQCWEYLAQKLVCSEFLDIVVSRRLLIFEAKNNCLNESTVVVKL